MPTSKSKAKEKVKNPIEKYEHAGGLSKRYNNPGEWKPIVYPGELGHLKRMAMSTAGDERIQSILFYIFCTGYRVIEFVSKMAIKLPKQRTILPGKVNLEIVEQDKESPDFGNEFVYDGWLELENDSPETIRRGLDVIQRAMDGLSFAFDSQVKWNLKYTIVNHSRGAAFPNLRDIGYLNKLIRDTQLQKGLVIDTAINWYRLGLLTQNPLNAFLCYHIAIEGVAVKLASGKLRSSEFFGFKKESKKTREQRMSKCFDRYYKKYYETDVEKMMKEAYFGCTDSIGHHLKRALETVFGKDHRFIEDYFNNDDGMWSIRGRLAHGEYSDWCYEEYLKVWHKLPLVQEIAKSFITRVVLQISSGRKRPGWSRSHNLSVEMDSPKATLVVSKLGVLPRKDWKIRPEWVD